MSDNYIADHILVDVLERLPFQSLCRFKCVSKSWRDLIDSSYIRGNHSRRSRLIQTYPHPDSKIIAQIGEQIYTFDSVVKKGKGLCKVNARQLRIPATRFFEQGFRIVGSCNGIVCLIAGKCAGLGNDLVLWNPFTCSYFELPSPPEEFTADVHFTSQAFGYDHINDDYKVVRWFVKRNIHYLNDRISPRQHELCVYSLKQNSWSVIRAGIPFELPEDEYFQYYFPEYDCTMVNCSAHWLGCGDSFIVAFDIGTYEFRKLSCRLFPQMSYRKMCSLNGCLSLVCYHRRVTDIWVMEEYGVELSWKKMASIDLLKGEEIKGLQMPVAMLQKGRKLLLKVYTNKLVIYDVEKKTVCKVAVKGETDWYEVCVCGDEDFCSGQYCYHAAYHVCVASFVSPAAYS